MARAGITKPRKPRKEKEPEGKAPVREVIMNRGCTLPQAEAFLFVCLKASPVKAHLEAALGHGCVASVADFASHDGDAQERADATIHYLLDVAEELDKRLRDQPRQLSFIDPSPGSKVPDHHEGAAEG